MRRREILNLKWGCVRNGLVYLKETRTKNPRVIPINDTLQRIFSNIRKEQGLTSQWVFTYCRRNTGRLDKPFKAALGLAGTEDFKFHDPWRTLASHVVMRGAGLKEVQELLRHKSISMPMRYGRLSQDQKKKAVNLSPGLTDAVKSDMSQNVAFPCSGKAANIQPPVITP